MMNHPTSYFVKQKLSEPYLAEVLHINFDVIKQGKRKASLSLFKVVLPILKFAC